MERTESVDRLAAVQGLLAELRAETACVMDELAAMERRLMERMREGAAGLWEATDAVQEELDALTCRVQFLERAVAAS
jgi:hypothetical protein